jgi:hypothetical protein
MPFALNARAGQKGSFQGVTPSQRQKEAFLKKSTAVVALHAVRVTAVPAVIKKKGSTCQLILQEEQV